LSLSIHDCDASGRGCGTVQVGAHRQSYPLSRIAASHFNAQLPRATTEVNYLVADPGSVCEKRANGRVSMLNKQLHRIPALGDWLINWSVQRELKRIKNKYLPLIKEAERAENVQLQAELTAQWAVERESVLDSIYVQNSADLIAQALKYGISAPPQEPDSKHYRKSGITGELILRQLAQRRLRREVRNEQRARNDEFRKWATVTFALLAFALGLVSLIVKTKQPDPCPRNYYRDDTGACIFALAPKSQVAPSQTALPEKHFDKAKKKPVGKP
jgi:hypothetical protein